jgi:hypothetical protein
MMLYMCCCRLCIVTASVTCVQGNQLGAVLRDYLRDMKVAGT